MTLRSERLKKFEAELADLEQWLKLGLVPKKDIAKHKSEIEGVKAKIKDEEKRLQFIKESGEAEEYVTPRKQPPRAQYTEAPTLPEMEASEESATLAGATAETEEETATETALTEERTEEGESSEEVRDEEDPFSDRNRWRRGMLHPDEDEW